MRNAAIRFCNSPNAVPYLASLGNEVVIRIDHQKCSDLLVICVSRHGVHVRPSRCVTVEDKVAGFGDLMAGKAGVVHRLVGGFAVVEMSEPPTAGRGVFS